MSSALTNFLETKSLSIIIRKKDFFKIELPESNYGFRFSVSRNNQGKLKWLSKIIISDSIDSALEMCYNRINPKSNDAQFLYWVKCISHIRVINLEFLTANSIELQVRQPQLGSVLINSNKSNNGSKTNDRRRNGRRFRLRSNSSVKRNPSRGNSANRANNNSGDSRYCNTCKSIQEKQKKQIGYVSEIRERPIHAKSDIRVY